MVSSRDEGKQRARFGPRSFYLERSKENRFVSEKIRRAEPPPESGSLSICNVHAEFLYQSGREESLRKSERNTRRGKRGAAESIQKDLINQKHAGSAGVFLVYAATSPANLYQSRRVPNRVP